MIFSLDDHSFDVLIVYTQGLNVLSLFELLNATQQEYWILCLGEKYWNFCWDLDCYVMGKQSTWNKFRSILKLSPLNKLPLYLKLFNYFVCTIKSPFGGDMLKFELKTLYIIHGVLRFKIEKTFKLSARIYYVLWYLNKPCHQIFYRLWCQDDKGAVIWQ